MPPPFNIYEHSEYRYALGTKGKRTLFCLGLNPSTATDIVSDNTTTKVENVVHRRGEAKDANFGKIFDNEKFDSFVMLNIYPLRATNPDELPGNIDKVTKSYEHKKNVDCILHWVTDNSVIWAAWGELPVKSRDWLQECLYDIIDNLRDPKKKTGIRWINMGPLIGKDKDEPRHPAARLSYEEFRAYDVNARRRR